MGLLLLFLLLNFAISAWNAHVVGMYWSEKSRLPDVVQAVLWAGAIMSVSGFFSVYVTVITAGMYWLDLFAPLAYALLKVELNPSDIDMLVQNIFDLAYLTIVLPVLGTGLIITVNSWIVAWARRDLTSIGVAGYNTFAQIYNSASAMRHIPRAAGSLSSGLKIRFNSKDGKALAYMVLLLFPVIISLGSAIVTTALIMQASDIKHQLEDIR